MKTERDRMLAGQLYDPLDAALVAARVRARDLCRALNASAESDTEGRRGLLRELFGAGGDSVWMQPPFFCDYGANIELGERVFFNFNCVVLDVCRMRIGSFTLFGPAVQVYTPMHPFDAALRRGQSLPRDPRGYRRSSVAAFCFMMSGRTSGFMFNFSNSATHFSGLMTG